MKIIPLVPRGYCKGVLQAIKIAKQTAIDYPNTPITVLGPIVHNHYVSDALNELGIRTLNDHRKSRYDLLDEIESGVVIFSAHGISEYVYTKAEQKGLTIVDASCSDVIAIKDKVMHYLNQGYQILYIGKKNHPESEGICYNHPEILCIETLEDIPNELDNDLVYVTTQTTMSTYQIEPLLECIQKRFKQCIIEPQICFATTSRQNALINMDDNIDGVIIVGDKSSNNTTKLEKLALSKPNVKVVSKINDLMELNESLFKDCQNVAITSGASTPNAITNAVIDYMTRYAKNETPIKQAIEIAQIL